MSLAATFSTAAMVRAETTLDLRFDDPMMLLEQAADIQAIPGIFSRSSATVASGNGGSADVSPRAGNAPVLRPPL